MKGYNEEKINKQKFLIGEFIIEFEGICDLYMD